MVTRTISRELLIELSIPVLDYLEDRLEADNRTSRTHAEQTEFDREKALSRHFGGVLTFGCTPRSPRRTKRRLRTESLYAERGAAPTPPALPLATLGHESVQCVAR
ncbi:hypothetical protein EI94DRAFT_1815388 [Lactarius quietus]|nr:hypothetical protein EI94DRAFT_1815388 [Lactarius quietus]